MGGNLAQIPNWSAQHSKGVRVGPLQIAAVDDIKTALALDAVGAGTRVAPTTALVIGQSGRNLRIVITDANNSSVTAWRIHGKDQFGNSISERFPASGSQTGAATLTGEKIFASVDSDGIECLTNTAGAAADSITIGSGNKVGLPVMLSGDLHEVLDMELQVANQATAATKKTVNSTNLDSTYMAVKAAAFAASAVVAGDSVSLRYLSDCLTPDDRSVYPSRS